MGKDTLKGDVSVEACTTTGKQGSQMDYPTVPGRYLYTVLGANQENQKTNQENIS